MVQGGIKILTLNYFSKIKIILKLTKIVLIIIIDIPLSPGGGYNG